MSTSMRKMLIWSFVVFGCILFYLYVYPFVLNSMMGARQMPPMTVSAMQVQEDTWQFRLQATGSLTTYNGIYVTPEIPGMVKEIIFAAGAEVNKGDPLVELNADTEKAQLAALEAQAELAKVTYERDLKQFNVKAVSKAALDTDEADLKNKKAQVAQQATIVEKKHIRAPFKGRLGIALVNVGQYLNPGDKIVSLQDLEHIYVNFHLPQQDLQHIAINQEVSLTVDGVKEAVYKGKITTINPDVDPATRNVEVQALMPNPKEQLLPGMYGLVEVNVGKPREFLTLPQAAVSYNPYGDIIYVLTEKEKDANDQTLYTANQKFVTLGETRGDQIQVLKGIEKGDLVVTSGQLKLKNGSVVIINNAVSPPNSANPEMSGDK